MTERILYVATGNIGKLRDFAIAAAQSSAEWTITTLPGLEAIAAPPEDGATFHENACAKALYYAQYAPGEIVLADDSGLAVDLLNGAPGVYSARYADQLGFAEKHRAQDHAPHTATNAIHATATKDERNNSCLLAELARFDSHVARIAHYHCALAAACDGTILATAEGSVSGEILNIPRGNNGFGYDPLFLLPQLGRTMAELDRETRFGLSHRGMALRLLLPQLTSLQS